MRFAIVLVWIGSAAVAAADPASTAAVDKVVRANLAASFTSHARLAATATADLAFAPAVDENRTPWWDDRCGDTFCNDEVMLFGGWIMLGMKPAPVKPRIVVDDAAHVAWFAADLKLIGTLGTGESITVKGAWPLRVTGILVDDHGWKVAAEKFSLVVPDATLVGKDDWVPNYGEITGKPSLEIAAWFPGHLAEHQSARAHAVNGTAPADVGRDRASMTKLAKAWDKLALVPKSVDVTALAGGKVAWAHATVTLPVKGGVKILTVGIVAVPEDGGWRWVSLNWSPEMQPDDAIH
jgi:hypothetical protein